MPPPISSPSSFHRTINGAIFLNSDRVGLFFNFTPSGWVPFEREEVRLGASDKDGASSLQTKFAAPHFRRRESSYVGQFSPFALGRSSSLNMGSNCVMLSAYAVGEPLTTQIRCVGVILVLVGSETVQEYAVFVKHEICSNSNVSSTWQERMGLILTLLSTSKRWQVIDYFTEVFFSYQSKLTQNTTSCTRFNNMIVLEMMYVSQIHKSLHARCWTKCFTLITSNFLKIATSCARFNNMINNHSGNTENDGRIVNYFTKTMKPHFSSPVIVSQVLQCRFDVWKLLRPMQTKKLQDNLLHSICN